MISGARYHLNKFYAFNVSTIPNNTSLQHIPSENPYGHVLDRKRVPIQSHKSEDIQVIIYFLKIIKNYFKIACCVQQKIAGLQISMQNICRVNVLETAQYLIEKVADMVV